MRICALALNWRQPAATVRCLDSVAAHASGIDVLVVDNGSDDGSIEAIRAAHPSVAILETGANLGYAGGNDAGFELLLDGKIEPGARLHGVPPATPEAVLVLNNDVELTAGCVDALTAAASADPGRGILAPVSLDARDPSRIDFATATVDLRTIDVHAHGRGSGTAPAADADSDYAPGSAFLIRRPALAALGGFERDFFLVWEDVDLSLRAAARGFGKPRIVAAAQVLHEGSVSFGGAATPRYRYYFVRNSYLLARRHLRGFALRRALRRLDRRYDGWAASADDPRIASAIRRGVEDAHAGRFGPGPDLDA